MGSLLKPLIAKVLNAFYQDAKTGQSGIGAECIKSRFIESFPKWHQAYCFEYW